MKICWLSEEKVSNIRKKISKDSLKIKHIQNILFKEVINKNIDISSFTQFLRDKKDSLNQNNIEVVTCNNYLNANKGLLNILKTSVMHLKYRKTTEESLGINLNCDIEQDASSSMKPDEVDYIFLENNLPKYISEFLELHSKGRMDNLSSGNDFSESLQSAVKLFMEISSTSSFVPSEELRSNSEVLQDKFSKMSGDYLDFLKRRKKDDPESPKNLESDIAKFKQDPTIPFNLRIYGSNSVDVKILKNIECGKNYIYSEKPCSEELDYKYFKSDRYPDDNGYCCYKENSQAYNCQNGYTPITLNGETNCIPSIA